MYSQNDDTGVLEVLEIKIFFAVQPGGMTLKDVLKTSLWVLQFTSGISTCFLKTNIVKHL